LRQLAAQRGLSPAAVDVASWSAYTSFLGRRTLDFDALRRLLKRLDGVEMSDELAGVFWTAAERFVGAALDSVRRLRTDPELDEDPTNLTALLHCLALLEGRGRGSRLGRIQSQSSTFQRMFGGFYSFVTRDGVRGSDQLDFFWPCWKAEDEVVDSVGFTLSL